MHAEAITAVGARRVLIDLRSRAIAHENIASAKTNVVSRVKIASSAAKLVIRTLRSMKAIPNTVLTNQPQGTVRGAIASVENQNQALRIPNKVKNKVRSCRPVLRRTYALKITSVRHAANPLDRTNAK